MPEHQPHRDRGGASSGLRLISVAVALVFALPLLFLIQQATSFGQPVLDALADPRNLAPTGRSLLLAFSVSATTAVLGTAAAWLVTRGDLPAARFWAVVLALPLVLPSYIGAFTLQAALAPGGLLDRAVGVSFPPVRGFWAAWPVMSLLTYPYVYLLVGARLRQLPSTMEETARSLGHRSSSIFLRVVLPQIRPAILAGALLVFLYTISDFGLPQLLRYDTLTRVIFSNILDRPVSTALAIQLAVLALLVTVGERSAVRRMSVDAPPGAEQVGGRTGLTWPLGRWRPLAIGGVAALSLAALVGPMSVLAYWTVRGFGVNRVREGSVFEDPAQLVAPLLGSLTAGLLAAVAAVVIVLPVAYLTARRRNREAATINAVVVSGFAVPGLIIALSLSFFLLRGPDLVAGLYQTLPALIIAYVVHFGAQSLRAAQVAVAAVPPSVIEASRTLGAGRLRRFGRVEAPMMAPSLTAGGGLVLLSVLKELPATLLLSPPGFRSLATEVWGATTEALWAEASALSLVLVSLSALLTWFLVLRRADALD